MSASDGPCPRLIEVALPIREISAESVRQKSAQRGHISTLHLWWARRPIAACRALVFASLVPDPDDPRCPVDFRAAVERLLHSEVASSLKFIGRGKKRQRDDDPYRPYDGIPDTPRNRLLTFIAKWSPGGLAYILGRAAKEPDIKFLIDDRSLVKWEISNPDNEQGCEVLRIARELVLLAHDGKPPSVLDPFSGGGAIPLEAGRLGARPFANDYNPVASLILRATCEFPQRWGKPGARVVPVPGLGKTQKATLQVPNALAYDFKTAANRVLDHVRERLAPMYPKGADGLPVLAYLWSRTVPCSNPSCQAEIPLLKSLLICNKAGKRVGLTMKIDKKKQKLQFGLARGGSLRVTEGTKSEKGPADCPFCGQSTAEEAIRRAGREGRMKQMMVAVVVDGPGGKDYRPVEEVDLVAWKQALSVAVDAPPERILPEITGAEEGVRIANSTGIRVHGYGLTTWGSLFNHRQLIAMQTLVDEVRAEGGADPANAHEPAYRQALETLLGLWVGRNMMRMSTVGRWHLSEEKVETPFDGARLPMKWDYPEANPLSAGTGGWASTVDWMVAVLEREGNGGVPATVSYGDGATLSLGAQRVDAVVTDPPYFDEAAYADLSDFFYVWLKRVLGDRIPDVFRTPQVPKAEEATALKHRHGGDAAAADAHFTRKLAAVFANSRRNAKADAIFTVVFAHQESEAWTALVNAMFQAELTIDATWPIEMELKNRPRGLNSAALQTSIAVVCRPRIIGSAASFRNVKREVEAAVRIAVKRFWQYGIRGADLVVSCYGPAVSVFGKHERVERADGTPVTVPELLDLAREAALGAIAGEFQGDNLSRLYFVWAQLYGSAEQPWDDARLVVQMGGEAETAIESAKRHGIFVVEGSKCRLALLVDREERRGLGADLNPPLVDALHQAMRLWKVEKRADLVSYLAAKNLLEDGPFWKLAQALFEVLPRGEEDWKLVNALLTERPTLRVEAQKLAGKEQVREPGLFDGKR